jgi:hypothetical protein
MQYILLIFIFEIKPKPEERRNGFNCLRSSTGLERKTLNLKAAGSNPAGGFLFASSVSISNFTTSFLRTFFSLRSFLFPNYLEPFEIWQNQNSPKCSLIHGESPYFRLSIFGIVCAALHSLVKDLNWIRAVYMPTGR